MCQWWHYLSIFIRLHRWSLVMDKWFNLTLYWAWDYISMLGLKLIHVRKRDPWYQVCWCPGEQGARTWAAVVLLQYDITCHYGDVIMSTMASQITAVSIVFAAISSQMKENIKALCHWPLWGGSTSHRWIPLTKGQWREKCFHLMTSSCAKSVRRATA